MSAIDTVVRTVKPKPADGHPAWELLTDHGLFHTAPAAAYIVGEWWQDMPCTLMLDQAGSVYGVRAGRVRARHVGEDETVDDGEDHATDRARDLVYGL